MNLQEELEFYVEHQDEIFEGKEIEEEEPIDHKNKCQKCNIERIVIPKDDMLVCTKCGSCFPYGMFDLSFNDTKNIKKTYLYKRMTHFMWFIKSIQGMNYVTMSEEDKEMITSLMELRRYINIKSLKAVLKYLSLSKLYKYGYYILNKLFGIELLRLSPFVESKMKMIQHPFKKYNKKRRSNFISYKFVLAKFALMLERPEILNYIIMLKSDIKMKEHNKMWRKICKKLKWKNYEIKY